MTFLYIYNLSALNKRLRFLHYAYASVVRSVSTSIASKQMRLVRASITIISQACKLIYLVTSSVVEKSNQLKIIG